MRQKIMYLGSMPGTLEKMSLALRSDLTNHCEPWVLQCRKLKHHQEGNEGGSFEAN